VALALLAVFTSGVRVAPVLRGCWSGFAAAGALPGAFAFAFAVVARAGGLGGEEAGLVLAFAFWAGRVLVAPAAAVALRAAVLRALDLCGRVCGRFDRTPRFASGELGRPLLSFGALIRTSLLKAHVASRSRRVLQAHRQIGRISATTR